MSRGASPAAPGPPVEGVSEFARRAIAPLPAPAGDAEARRAARELLALLGAAGWCRHAVPAAHGGVAERPSLGALCAIREALAAASPLADAVYALQALGSMPITLSGNAEMQRRWLPEVASGAAMAAFAMTEPEAGSDVAAMATRAVADGDGYVLEGRKHLISNAGIADFYCVFASTDPERGSRGVSCFVVPADAPGLRFAAAQVMSEPHPLGEIVLEGCRVPAEARLGDEGEGMKLGLRALDRLRPTVAAAACGMAARALEEALSHARSRRQFGAPLAELPLVQQKLARMATDLEAARLLVRRAAEAADGGAERITLEAAQAKLFATEAAQRIVDDAVQIHGGRGVLAESVVDRLYRSVRALRIYEGTSEVQHLVIARELLR
ncbi:MAG TPA: acyl-CoA dehydrogenase family protein [Thermoanaerobaculia bacterium]|nr:acyl-CoA dehydrogenase family protein [Thermoanaerobaculia bacterium]